MPQRCRELFCVLQELPLPEDSHGITDAKPSPAEARCARHEFQIYRREDGGAYTTRISFTASLERYLGRGDEVEMAKALRAVIKLAMDAQHSDEEIIACLRDLIDDIRNKKFWSKL